MKYVSDLKPYFTEFLNVDGTIDGLWIVENEEETEKILIVKFKDKVPKVEREVLLFIFGKNLIDKAATEDDAAGGKSSFGNLLDGMQIREWKKEDDEIIQNGIPHDIV